MPNPWKGVPPLPKDLHTGTAAICRSPMQKIVINNANHVHYENITRTEKFYGGKPLPLDIFVPGIKPPLPNAKQFSIHSEESFRSFFYPAQSKLKLVLYRVQIMLLSVTVLMINIKTY